MNLDKVMKSADDVTHYHGLAQRASAIRGSYLQLGSPPNSTMQLPTYPTNHGGGVAVGTPGNRVQERALPLSFPPPPSKVEFCADRFLSPSLSYIDQASPTHMVIHSSRYL